MARFRQGGFTEIVDIRIMLKEDLFPPRTENYSTPTEDSSVTICVDCGAIFNSQSEYEIHQKEHSSVLSQENFLMCPKCCVLCRSQKDLERHMTCHVVCTVCKSEFTAMVKDTFADKCCNCRNLFKAKISLKRGNTKSSYKCDSCTRCFTQKSNLSRHLLSHMGPKKHMCRLCGVSYRILSSLTKHMIAVHT